MASKSTTDQSCRRRIFAAPSPTHFISNFPSFEAVTEKIGLFKCGVLFLHHFYCGPNYRPISNMSTVSKVPERPVLARLQPHLLGCANFSQFQSAYRKGHSTETADDKHVTFLIGLDLFAAFQWRN